MPERDDKKPPRQPAPTVYEPRSGDPPPRGSDAGSGGPGVDFWKSVGKASAHPSAASGTAGPKGGSRDYQGRIPIGTQLNHIYEIRRFINRGGMGEVYEGVNISTDERVAIKFLLTHLAEDPQVKEMFRQEPQKLARLNHPALVQYRLATTEPKLGLFYIVTEYVDGPGLDGQIGKIRPSTEEIKRLTRWLAQGLGAAHHAGVYHRDVSPDNILLPDGRLDRAKIIDFGIAKGTKAGQATIIGQGFAGKLNFVAPEQIGDFGRSIGPWTDIYSLGLVMLALATGRAADLGGTAVAAVDRRRAGVDLSEAPPSLRPIFARMLAANPKDRFQTTDELIAALDALAGDDPRSERVPVRPPPPPPPAAGHDLPTPPRSVPPRAAPPRHAPARHVASGRTVAIAGVAAAALVVLGAGWLIVGGKHRSAPAATSAAVGAEAVLDPVLKSVRCGWPSVAPSSDAGGAYEVVGRALDFRAENGKIAEAVRGRQADGHDLAVDPRLGGGARAAQCAALEAFNHARAPLASETWLTAANPSVVRMARSECHDDPAKGAAVVTGTIPNRDDMGGGDAAMVLLEPDGQLHSVFNGRDALAALAQASPSSASFSDSGVFKVTVCLSKPGPNGVALLSGKPPFDLGLPKVGESRGAPASFFATFNEASDAKRPQVQMVWFTLEAGAGQSPATAPAPEAPNRTTAERRAPPRHGARVPLETRKKPGPPAKAAPRPDDAVVLRPVA